MARYDEYDEKDFNTWSIPEYEPYYEDSKVVEMLKEERIRRIIREELKNFKKQDTIKLDTIRLKVDDDMAKACAKIASIIQDFDAIRASVICALIVKQIALEAVEPVNDDTINSFLYYFLNLVKTYEV